jgi:hypothetical protein
MTPTGLFTVSQVLFATVALAATDSQEHLKVRLFWGHQLRQTAPYHVQFVAEEVVIADIAPIGLEPGDSFEHGTFQTHAGKGDIDGTEFTLRYAAREVKRIDNLHRIWADLIAQSDKDTARRLQQDPAHRPDSRKLTVQMNPAGTRGFSVTVDQLLASKAFWVPSLDVYFAVGDDPLSFADHQKHVGAYKGTRVLDQAQHEPEATYEQYTARWEDMGSPSYAHPAQPAPGHIVGLTWDSALYKFGIDRGAGVWNDYGNPDRFRFWFAFGELSEGLQDSWKGQRLEGGLPVITTVFERDGLRYKVEQFAYPLNGPPKQRQGDIGMVLLQRVRVTNLQSQTTTVPVRMYHRREFASSDTAQVTWRSDGDIFLFEESAAHRILFAVDGPGLKITSCVTRDDPRSSDEKKSTRSKNIEAVLTFGLASSASQEFVVKLPSPMVFPHDRDKLLKLDYASSREASLKFWSDYAARGAQFRVPEKVVNDLFRANLWHALRLPRRHGGQEEGVKIDLPYSNFAYDQHGTPWPVNQAVYVDYMIYGLRGYYDIATEELLTIYRSNQQPNGHVTGYANWGVYTPSMIYVVAKNYLLSGDQDAFDELLPYTLKALDWCRNEIHRSSEPRRAGSGLIRAPLNDGSGEGTWAFTQAYVYAALEMLGKALEQTGHPRAQECLQAAESFQQSVERAFRVATMRSPLVQLQDHTWIPYVPCEATKPGRLFTQWYPTDVDTGATHLLRLKALAADSALADYLLNDHEDNLYLNGWGMANEPVYNPQATAYLLRDDPKAVIRAFYSYMACAFSHSVLEPVEHRWTWGQYFGPPSTDGAWFELYRHMLIHELDDNSLLLLQATPRKWLEDGKRIEVEHAPTYYGELSMSVESKAASGQLTAQIDMPKRRSPNRLVVRFRHPQGKPMQSVTVNGQEWDSFDTQKEWVLIPKPGQQRYSIIARY